MNRPPETRRSEPAMRDAADRELHRKEGVDPYPVPRRAEQATRDEGDLQDPAKADRRAPHDRGTTADGDYASGVDAMKQKLKDEGVKGAWKDGRTQGAPRKH